MTLGPTILSLNPGSSSFKAALRDPADLLTVAGSGGFLTVEEQYGRPHRRPFAGDAADAVGAIRLEMAERALVPDAVAHRVVHGGPHHHQPTVVDDNLLDDLRRLIPLAPLHLPDDLASIAAARAAWPGVPHVVCFDTGFHHDLPPADRRLPVPQQLVDAGIRRYGFHGLSMQSVLHALPDSDQMVVAHLGSGCSVTAIVDGRSRHTTMSLTPTGGMVSVTRSGDLDPEVVLYLLEHHGFRAGELRDLLERRAGMSGVAGDSRTDVRTLLESRDERAVTAMSLFVHSAAAAIATCATVVDRWDTLVFTGGIGENSAQVRELVCARLLPLRGAATGGGAAVEALSSSGVRVLVVPADEEGVLDRAARAVLAATPLSGTREPSRTP